MVSALSDELPIIEEYELNPPEDLSISTMGLVTVSFNCEFCGESNLFFTPNFSVGGFDCNKCKKTNVINR